jgi:molecular chaperone DnaJ
VLIGLINWEMADYNHYETLNLKQNASHEEIKQAYRRMAKLFHPDTNQETTDHEKIIRINAAYEILGDSKSRQSYDRQLRYKGQIPNSDRHQRSTASQQSYHAKRKTGRDVDEEVDKWLRQIYEPVNQVIFQILNSLEDQIEKLAADPFDDELLEAFQDYLSACRDDLKQAQLTFRSLPNPPSLARAAAHLYYSLNQIGDGLGELEYFPLNYDESYLHAGQEMFRIATQLHFEAQDSVNRS